MVPFTYFDKLIPLDDSYQPSKNNSVTHQYAAKNLNKFNNQPVVNNESPGYKITVPPSSSNKRIRSRLTSSSVKSKATTAEGLNLRAMKPSSSHFKCSPTSPQDLYWKSSFHPIWKAPNSSLLYAKPLKTTPPSLNKTSSSLEPNQTSLSSRLVLPKPPTSTPNSNLCWKSSFKPTPKVSSLSLSTIEHQETPSLNIILASPSLRTNKSSPVSPLRPPKSQETSSLDCLWTSLLECDKKSLNSSFLDSKVQRNESFLTSPSLESNRMGHSLSLSDSRLHKVPISSSKSSVPSLPVSHLKVRKPPLTSHSVHHSQSLPSFQPKPKSVIRLDLNSRPLNSPLCPSKSQNTSLSNDKQRTTPLPPFRSKTQIPGPPSSPKPWIRKRTASTLSSKFQSKGKSEPGAKLTREDTVPWNLDYSHPCIVKGGTIPAEIVNKIVKSVSRTTIQKDLSRQILFRRMRGRPNPRPGPRLSTTYTVCLDCASCIRSPCCHLSGKKDPRSATLFAIPTPDASAQGKVEVKLLLILSLPETAPTCYALPMKDNAVDEVSEENLDDLEKITHFFPACESDIIQGLKGRKKCLAASPENTALNHSPQSVDWLLYVKNRNNFQSQSQLPAHSSSSSSSFSSASSSSSSSSSHSVLPSTPPPPCKEPPPSPILSCSLTKGQSYHRLPPGVSWFEFIHSKDYQVLPEPPAKGQVSSSKTKRGRNHTPKKGRKRPNTVLKYFQSKW